MADMLTIRQTVARARDENLPLSEYALRLWIRSGALPARKVGNKFLLFWPNVKNFAICADGSDNSNADKPKNVGR